MQVIKLDEDAHLEFILHKLNEKFGSFEVDYSDEESSDDSPTPGPFQVNIPLGDNKDVDNSPDVAIVVAPTNTNFMAGDQSGDKTKKNEKKDENQGGEVFDDEEVDTTTVGLGKDFLLYI